uniref:Apple domain-containing protein n=1 Tax=Panagrellus redivivus TaxID=6233 RepID=A0A7E4VAU7_PANRE
MGTTYLVLFLYIFPIHCYGKTAFVHLVGYELLADTLSTYPTYDNGECLKACTETVACLAVQMSPGIGDCRLLTMVRSAEPDEWLCQYFIKNLTTVNVNSRTLTPAEQLIQNAVYASQGSCPDGWTANSTICTLSVSESVCREYASFLEATWDGIDCGIPMMDKIYNCPSSQLTLKNFTHGYFCYATIVHHYFTKRLNTTTNAKLMIEFLDLPETGCQTLKKRHISDYGFISIFCDNCLSFCHRKSYRCLSMF